MRELEKILEEIEKIEKEYICEEHHPLFKMGAAGIASEIKDVIQEHMNGKDKDVLASDAWIPVEEDHPKTNDYILLSFANFNLPLVGRYEGNEESGAFYLGDCDEEDTCISQDLYVNAWQPLPAPYRQERSEEE